MESATGETQKYSTWPQIYASFSAYLAVFSAGSIIGWMPTASEHLQDPDSGYLMDYDQISRIASVFYLGHAAGPLITMLLADRIGRKKTQLAAYSFYSTAWLIVIFSKGYVLLVIARILMGIGSGITISCCPLYVAEITEDKKRGAFLSLTAPFLTLGVLYSSIIGSRTSLLVSSQCASLIPFLFWVMFSFAPESPHFFEKNGRRKEALKALMWLRGVKKEESVAEEIESISQFVGKEKENCNFVYTLKEITRKDHLKIIAIPLVLFFAQQFSGMTIMTVYTETTRGDIDSPVNPLNAFILYALVALFFFAIASAIVDCCGRRLLILSSCAGICVANLLTGTYLFLSNQGVIDSSYSWVAMVGMFGFSVFMPIGLSSVPFILLGELFPFSIRSWGISFVCIYQTGLVFAAMKLIQVIDSAIGGYFSYFIFAIGVFISSVYIYLFMPETKRMSLNEIQEKLKEPANKTMKL